jgi:hypothetical protein
MGILQKNSENISEQTAKEILPSQKRLLATIHYLERMKKTRDVEVELRRTT